MVSKAWILNNIYVSVIMSETGVMSWVVLARHLSYIGYIGVGMLMMFFLVIVELASRMSSVFAAITISILM